MACRTGILTFQNANNYGAVLQAFALQTTLKDLGHEVSIINYDSPYMELKSCQSNDFNEFIKRYLELTDEYSCSEEIKADDYDLLITGSDQVWNPLITKEDEAYFLDFKKEHTKGVSYAASIGIYGAELDKYRDFFVRNIGRFESISIREKIQKDFVTDISGKEVNINIDPSLLLSADRYMDKFNITIKKSNYIFMYSNNIDAKILDFVNLLSVYTGLPVVSVSRYEEMMFTDGSKAYDQVSPVEWMQAIAAAAVVITDSFHGLMFSLIFEKPFYMYTKKRYNISRITDILDACGLSDRKLCNLASVKDLVYEIDFTGTREFVAEGKKKAIEYLNSLGL